MKRRDIILFVGIIVASIIGTKSFANPVDNSKSEEIGAEEINKLIKNIRNNPEFSIFYKAIDQAKLSKEIAKLDDMTLFIPTNKAFKLLPGDVWENFMDEENQDALIELLNYHVVPEKLTFDDLKMKEELETLDNQYVHLSTNGDLKIENALVEEKAEESKDFIVYQLDRLIMPLN